MKFSLLVLLLGLVSQSTFAQGAELLERSFSGSSKQTLPQAARQEIIGQAYNKVSEDVIKELIGEERFAKNKTTIHSKIIRNAARYTPFSKPGELVSENIGFRMSVSIKISLKDLKAMLQTHGLLNENESTPVVIPVINFVDRVSMTSYRWWQSGDKDAKVFLLNQARYYENSLRKSFQRNGFYLLKPQEAGAHVDIPMSFQNEKLNIEDSQFFGQYFNASVLLDGQVQINKHPQVANSFRIELRISATQISNSRPIADVSRKFDTEVGAYEVVVDKRMKEIAESVSNDLASQVLEAWQRGSLGTSMLKITLNGKLDLPFLEAFKERLKNQVTQIRNVRERLFESGKYSFEADTAASASEIVKKIQGMDVGNKKVTSVSEVAGVNNEISVQIN